MAAVMLLCGYNVVCYTNTHTQSDNNTVQGRAPTHNDTAYLLQVHPPVLCPIERERDMPEVNRQWYCLIRTPSPHILVQ